ncbi:MAG: DNA polymerase III subunit chi [Methylococcales bacterium]
MLEVSFYILPSPSLAERDLFTCKLAEKAYRQKLYSLILTVSDAHSQIMDDLLWTFRANSFLPHQIIVENQSAIPNQILISTNQTYPHYASTLINLSQQFPGELLRYQRILEILHQDDSILQAGRDRYRQYQQAGATMTTHKL